MFNWAFHFMDWYYNSQGTPGPTMVITIVIAIFSLVAIFRFIRTFIHYVQTGELGDSDNYLVENLGDVEFKKAAYDFLLEPHPMTILADAAFLLLLGITVVLALGVIPILVEAAIPFALVILLARYLRRRVAKKEEFINTLKGKRDL